MSVNVVSFVMHAFVFASIEGFSTNILICGAEHLLPLLVLTVTDKAQILNWLKKKSGNKACFIKSLMFYGSAGINNCQAKTFLFAHSNCNMFFRALHDWTILLVLFQMCFYGDVTQPAK